MKFDQALPERVTGPLLVVGEGSLRFHNGRHPRRERPLLAVVVAVVACCILDQPPLVDRGGA